MNFLEMSEDLLDIEVDVRMSVRSLLYLMNVTTMYLEMTGDQELLDVYEQMFNALEPYGTVQTKDDEDGEDQG